jgi:hypothetical protein
MALENYFQRVYSTQKSATCSLKVHEGDTEIGKRDLKDQMKGNSNGKSV